MNCKANGTISVLNGFQSFPRELKKGQIQTNGSYCTLLESQKGARQHLIEACFHREDSEQRKRILLTLVDVENNWQLKTVDLCTVGCFQMKKQLCFVQEHRVGPFGADVDVTDYGTRVRDVSSMEKTLVSEHVLKDSFLKKELPREYILSTTEILNALRLMEILESLFQKNVLALHDGAFVVSHSNSEEWMACMGCLQHPKMAVYVSSKAVHFLS